ncbi:hypothetical protein J2Y55_004581 [Bosea sp. BE125]|uniref:SLOG domain-containing protein n=1 Tax=Bosea sp. BE125 TaxID=2817909 RepID=UPI00285F31AF|nr:hypothetical protein [Bosea sp. BE125]MDR6873554.1 hypothetical protein [Bosea sp. BE125]
MMTVFLSASIPDPNRHPRYYGTADNIAIRDAVRALATVVLPHAALHWGGHPAITPLIRVVAESVGLTSSDRVQLYQSAWFSSIFPTDNAAFEKYHLTPRGSSREESLATMRDTMLTSVKYDAGIFIGGMEGVEEEFDMFQSIHPKALLLPVATTGAAARIVYETRRRFQFPTELATEYAYPSLFRRLLRIRNRPR